MPWPLHLPKNSVDAQRLRLTRWRRIVQRQHLVERPLVGDQLRCEQFTSAFAAPEHPATAHDCAAEDRAPYHFRVQAQNSDGTVVSGSDATFVAGAPAPYTWVSPTGYSDPDNVWLTPSNAFDDELGTTARSYHNIYADNWGSFLYLTRASTASEEALINVAGL